MTSVTYIFDRLSLFVSVMIHVYVDSDARDYTHEYKLKLHGRHLAPSVTRRSVAAQQMKMIYDRAQSLSARFMHNVLLYRHLTNYPLSKCRVSDYGLIYKLQDK